MKCIECGDEIEKPRVFSKWCRTCLYERHVCLYKGLRNHVSARYAIGADKDEVEDKNVTDRT